MQVLAIGRNSPSQHESLAHCQGLTYHFAFRSALPKRATCHLKKMTSLRADNISIRVRWLAGQLAPSNSSLPPRARPRCLTLSRVSSVISDHHFTNTDGRRGNGRLPPLSTSPFTSRFRPRSFFSMYRGRTKTHAHVSVQMAQVVVAFSFLGATSPLE